MIASQPEVMVDCHLDREARTVEGWVSVTLTNPTDAPLERFYLWLYPNRFAEETPGLDDVTRYWVYPRRFEPGGMRLERVSVEQGGARVEVSRGDWRAEPQSAAGRDVLWSIALPRPIAPGERVRIAARYRARIPERYGAFGCVEGQCTMAGGFYPMPAAIDRAGWDLLAPPLRATTDVKVTLEEPASIVLFDQWSGNGAAAFRVRVPAVRYATLVVAPEHFESSRIAGGARIRYLSPEPPPPADDARKVVLAYTLEDHGRFALDTATAAFGVLHELDPRLRPTALTMVVAPLRLELATAHERTVLVSDRFYRIWPAERFRKFHRRQLARAIYAAWLLRQPMSTGPLDRDEAADLAASWLTDLFVLKRWERSEFIQNIVRPVSFIPAIDQLLYATQTMFADAYFGDAAPVTAGSAVRDDPRLFASARPRGRFTYARLRDLLGDGRLAGALTAFLHGEELGGALARVHGASLGWFFRQWSLPAARVNVRLVGHSSKREKNGYQNRVEIAREIAAGDTAPVEPVDIRVTEKDGSRRRLRWSGRTGRAALSYHSTQPIAWAWVDPDGRVEQSSALHPSQDPRFDDRDHHQLRFVYNSFGVLLNVSDLSALLAADFSLSRVHDLENQVRFIAYASAAVRAGALVSYRRGFGPVVSPDRLLGRAALTLGAARLDGDFFAGADDDMPRDATQATLTGSLGGDTEVFVFEPLAKQESRVAASFTLTRRDATSTEPSDVLPSGDVLAMTTRTLTPRLGHTLAAELSVAAAFGDIESRTQLLTPGGADGVRGLAPGALFARAAATVRAEYRHAFVHDLDWNFGHYTFVRGIGGVAFVDAGLASPCSGYLPENREALFTAAGYGLQFVYDSFGTLPSLMRIDGAVRLSGRAAPCLGEETTGGTAVQLYVSFLPPF